MEYDPDELMHYGIKGMKWGVRRFQNEDGTLTALGKKRQALDSARETARKHPERANSRINLNYARNEYRDQKILDKIAKQKTKSKRQLNLEEKYKEQGFSEKDAAIQAYKRARTERALAIAGGMTLAAVGAYVAHRHYDSVTDQFIEAGKKLGRISSNDEEGVKDAFYAFANSHDAKRYTALYGQQTMDRAGRVFRKNLTIGPSGLKVASRDSAKRALSDLMKNDPQYRSDIMNLLQTSELFFATGKARNVLGRAFNDLKNGKGVTNNVYDAVNNMLVVHNETGNRASGKFYDKLKSLGYSAIRDTNDTRYSGYRTWNPLIVFDSSKVKVDSVKQIGQSVINQTFLKDLPVIAIEGTGEILSDNIHIAAPALAIPAAMLVSDRVNMNRYIRDYYEQHPNSKMSRNDLIRRYQQETD